jgi:hypothetical protein
MGKALSFNLNCSKIFSDPDDDEMTYTVFLKNSTNSEVQIKAKDSLWLKFDPDLCVIFG